MPFEIKFTHVDSAVISKVCRIETSYAAGLSRTRLDRHADASLVRLGIA